MKMNRPYKIQDRTIHYFFAIEYNKIGDVLTPRVGKEFNNLGHRTWTCVMKTEPEAVWQFMKCNDGEYVKIHSIVIRLSCTKDGKLL